VIGSQWSSANADGWLRGTVVERCNVLASIRHHNTMCYCILAFIMLVIFVTILSDVWWCALFV